MPDQDKKVKPTEKSADKKQQGTTTRDYSDLKRLRCLLNVQSSKQQLPAINFDSAPNSMTKSEAAIKAGGHRARGQWHESTEAVELENFSINYKNERNFSKHPQHQLFQEIFTALVRNRLICREWVNRAPSIHFLRVLICLRLLMRDPCYQEILHKLGGIEDLAQYMEIVANEYLGYAEEQHCVDKLVNMTYIFQKLAAVKDQREWVTASGAHKTLVNLLGARDTNVLLGTLLALASLAESPECREKISELNIVENLLMILHEYDLLSKRLTAELLRLLCAEPQVKEQVKLYEGIPILLSLLHSDHLKLLWSVVWILVQVCEDPDTSVEIRIWGGIKQLLHILRGDRNFVSDRSSIGSLSSANAAGRIQQLHLSEDLSPGEIQENTVSLQAACCAALTELALNDTNAHQVVQENGVYTIAKLILPNKQKNAAKTNLLQCYAFRALRFLFSMERNRPLFKRLFPTDLFEIFIDIGHYVRDISAYEDLVSQLNLLLEDELKQIAENIESINQKKAPLKYIGDYAVLDHLGSGAFGCVYKVRKRSGQNLLAMKEVNLHNPAFGKDKKDRDSSVKNIVSELTIIKEQLYHPNIVRYYKTFLENDRLYIVMELIEGAPLAEHFSSLKEKQQHFTEERLWRIFIQLCLALRYLHKEKRIVHRDLTPNNIMLGDKDKVTPMPHDTLIKKQKQNRGKIPLRCSLFNLTPQLVLPGCFLYSAYREALLINTFYQSVFQVYTPSPFIFLILHGELLFSLEWSVSFLLVRETERERENTIGSSDCHHTPAFPGPSPRVPGGEQSMFPCFHEIIFTQELMDIINNCEPELHREFSVFPEQGVFLILVLKHSFPIVFDFHYDWFNPYSGGLSHSTQCLVMGVCFCFQQVLDEGSMMVDNLPTIVQIVSWSQSCRSLDIFFFKVQFSLQANNGSLFYSHMLSSPSLLFLLVPSPFTAPLLTSHVLWGTCPFPLLYVQEAVSYTNLFKEIYPFPLNFQILWSTGFQRKDVGEFHRHLSQTHLWPWGSKTRLILRMFQY
ncbi:Nek10 [Phodopus roborovskii]|uniref:Nek10 protein n=1 Tax=Phodopus roborovskii TaxID=109678 RepID=A0AAV0AAM4_PHORO|nr:Nek10 [Phodopus roborovskii]